MAAYGFVPSAPRYPSAMQAYFGATPEQVFNLQEVARDMKGAGCPYLAEMTHEVGLFS